MKAYYQTTTRWMVMFNLPVFLTSVLFAKQLLWIFGDDFTAGAPSMMIMAVGTLVYTATGVGANILDMTDHPTINTINSVVMVIVTILLNLLFIPPLGVVGAAIASTVSTVVVNVLCLVEVWVILGMQPYNFSFIKPIAASLAAALVTLILNHFLHLPVLLQLMVGCSALWFIYASVLYLLKFSPDDQIVLGRFLSRLQSKLPKTQDVSQC
jgi:O-antigen/teichoic acid export membrane protein